VIVGEFRGGLPRLTVTLFGGNGRLEVEVTVDTGFQGELKLPPDLLRQIGAPKVGVQPMRFANGAIRQCDVHAVEIEWDGERRVTEAVSIEDEPLLGNALMEGYQLTVEMQEGGEVIIEAM
jgi:clan AA aspartic protease